MVTRVILVALFLAVVFGGIFGWKQHTAQQMAAAQAGGPPPAVIAAASVELESWQPYIQVVGSLEAVAGIEVTSEVGGQVSAINFNSGEWVKRGDLLLELDSQTDQAQLKGLLAERTLGRLNFERVAKLVKERSVSKSDYDEARATLDAAEARVTGQQALIDKKRIRAPFDGRLGIRRVDLGEYLSPGSAIVPLEQLDPMYADFTLPERDLARVGNGPGGGCPGAGLSGPDLQRPDHRHRPRRERGHPQFPSARPTRQPRSTAASRHVRRRPRAAAAARRCDHDTGHGDQLRPLWRLGFRDRAERRPGTSSAAVRSKPAARATAGFRSCPA